MTNTARCGGDAYTAFCCTAELCSNPNVDAVLEDRSLLGLKAT